MLEAVMKLLVCPGCLPEEYGLELRADRREGDDVIAGTLTCPACGAAYAIADGVADLVPGHAAVPEAQARYDEERLAASYLWAHFADLWDDPEATPAYAAWLTALGDCSGPALDAGCAVGRFTLELAARTGLAVGVDLSRNFVTLARRIARQGGLAFDAPWQGLLTTRFSCELPQRLPRGTVEFVRADALALPFARGRFGTVASLNVLDKLPKPRRHIEECRRVCAAPATLLVADPFSWSPDIAAPEDWIGGRPDAGESGPCLAKLLADAPGWTARQAESVAWTIRDHKNRFERIRSETVVARRAPL
ncbi:methyltransferase domain-containing protein [Solidesulfovibrio sp.]|uniref:class I SAM-dependent methyltransferase n=1 Tax=Solidesulfovibrio sp. TaxID=2910990 RepID=UPI0026329A6B|nr:methyltransferase domain-containing protein [Solidesulfovibrio sp.]